MSTYQVGLAETDITPPVGAWLIGCEGPSTGVHDPLWARALVLDDGDTRVALVHLDLCGLHSMQANAIREAVAARCGLAASYVVLVSSHTHSAPFTLPWSLTGWAHLQQHEMAWVDTLPTHIADVVEQAMRNKTPSRLGYARAPVQIGQNRRAGGYASNGAGSEAQMLPDPNGSIVSWSDVITVTGVDGTLRAVLYSQAAHPVMIHKASPLISADYPFYAGQRIRERLGADVMPLFAQACGADNNAPWATGWETCERVGRRLGDAVADACARAVQLDRPLHFQSSVLDVPLKPLPPAEQLQRTIAQEQQRPDAERLFNISSGDQLLVAQERLRLHQQGGAATHMPLEMALLTIGEQCALVMLSSEIFSGYQLAIERISPFAHTAVWAYCQQTENYIPTDAEQARGGYEIKGGPAFYPYRSGPALGAEPLILGRVAEMLSRAYSG